MSERPVECGECKRPVKVIYKEILPSGTTCTQMCADCPVLQEKLHGERTSPSTQQLCCKLCGTTLELVQLGQPVGCAECYVIFDEFLLHDLVAMEALPPPLQKNMSAKQLHTGKSPHLSSNAELSSQLLSLNEALNEALKRENFEQAAFLRDQIKNLTKKP